MSREFWLEGPVEGIPPHLMPVAHALLQSQHDLRAATTGITSERLWLRPNGAASIGFHIRHIAGSMDRLLSYALGQELTQEQREHLAAEKTEPAERPSVENLLDRVNATVDKALRLLRDTPESSLLDARLVGRAQRPSTVLGLLFHAAEHTQRHAGQVITTAKIVGGSSLSGTIAELTSRWSLTIGKQFDAAGGTTSWVARATLQDGSSAVLKIGIPHMESTHEAAGLRFWNGDGTVRLLQADEKSGAMLIELCEPGTPLRELPEEKQDEVIAGLLRRLWQAPPAPHPFRPLATMIDHWVRESIAAANRWGDPGLVQEGLDLLSQLSRSAPTEMLLTTDLHAGNVLRAEREPWLVIDPKPFIGDPAYDATQHLLNCRERLKRDWRGTIGRFADLLEVDPERIRLWLFARAAAEPREAWRGDELSDLARRLSGR